MLLTFDQAKNAQNTQERGMPFSMVAQFDWHSAWINEDTRKDYQETRYQALGFIDETFCMLIFTFRDPAIHIISLRKANRRERRKYDQAQAQSRNVG